MSGESNPQAGSRPAPTLGLFAVTFIAVGFTIGAGVFVFTGIVAKMTGPALPLAYGLAVIPVFIAMLPLAMLGATVPTVGGNYTYPSRMVSPGLAFVGIWVYVLASFLGQVPLYALACARYAQVFWPALPLELGAAALLTAFFLVNLFGLRLATVAQGVMVLVLLAALLAYALAGFAASEPAHFEGLLQTGPGNLALGVALLTFTYFGSNGIIELGAEIEDPGRTIPRALFIAFPLVTVIYLLVAVATVGALPWTELVDEPEPLVKVARVTLGETGLGLFVAGGAILGLTTTLNALFIVGTRSLLAMVRDGLLPDALGRHHPRFGTPDLLLLCIWVLSLAGVFSGLPLETFASYAALGGMVLFAPVLVAALVLPRRFPERWQASRFRLRGLWHWLCPAIGFLMVLFFSTVLLVDLGSLLEVGLFGAFVVSGLAAYLGRRATLRRRGVDLASLRERDDWIA